MRIREAVADDVDALASIEGVGWTREAFAAEIGNGLLAAEENGVVGFAAVRPVAGEAQVYMIAVAAGARRRGVGRALLSRGLDRAKSAGCDRATLEVSEKNAAAVKLYESFGFRVVGRRTKYYNDGADALLMDASL
jgi:ribosomal-protein-alanine acetyltransferase